MHHDVGIGWQLVFEVHFGGGLHLLGAVSDHPMVGMHICYNKLLLIVTHQHVGLLQWTAHNMP